MSANVRIPKLKLSHILEEIQDNILFKLFGSEYINVKTVLQTMSQVVKADGYEFELRYIDNKGQTSKTLWNQFKEENNKLLELVEYDDDIIYTYQTSLPLSGVRFRSYAKSNIYERKTLINSIVARSEDPNITPLKINLSKEATMSPNKQLNRYDNIQRRQRCSYRFKHNETMPYLANWRVDKTIRLFTRSLSDKKLSLNLDISNLETLTYYDCLDIEFEYIGDFSEILVSFFELIKTIYKPYEYFDVEYLIIKQVLSTVIKPDQLSNKNIISCIPSPIMMTNDILQVSSIKDYMITNKYKGKHSLIVCFGEINQFVIYSLTENKITNICGDLHLLNIGKINHNVPNTIESIIRSFTENKHIDYLPTISVFESMSNDETNENILTDTLIYDNELIQAKPLIERKKYIDDFINQYKLANNGFINAKVLKANSWNDILEKRNKSYIAKPLNEPLFEAKTYKITFYEQITINFKVEHVPIKRLFYLYVIGSISQVVEAKTITNKYSIDHFGYSLIGSNCSSCGGGNSLNNLNNSSEVYLLYVSPYVKESYVLRPEAYSKNPILADMYANPISYNGKIIKMTRANDSNATWQPLEIVETDKPDSYSLALKLESLIFDHLHINLYNPNKQLVTIKPLYDSVYELLDQYTVERALATNPPKIIVDIVNEDNGNIPLLYNLGQIDFVYAVSNNKHTLTSIIEQTTNKEFNKHIFLDSTKARSDNKLFSINSVYSSLQRNELIFELNRKWNYTPKSVDMIYFEDCYEQIESLIDVINFRQICDEILNPNGKIVFKIFDGNKIAELINTINAVSANSGTQTTSISAAITPVSAPKRRRRTTAATSSALERKLLLNINYVNESKLNSQLVDRLKTISRIFKPLSKEKISIENNNVLVVGNKRFKFPECYDLDDLTHEQLNSLALIATSYKQSENTYHPLSRIQINNLKKILGVNVELFVDAFNRTLEHFYSQHYEVDKFVGSLGSIDEIIKTRSAINNGVIIQREHLTEPEKQYIQTRLKSSYSTVIITKDDLPFGTKIKLIDVVDDISCDYMYILFPYFVDKDDMISLIQYINQYVVNNENNETVFRLYTHPKTSSCNYTPRMLFNIEFMKFIYEKFKLVDVCNPLTKNEIATYIATNRQYSNFETIEQYLNCYTVITAERI